MSVGAMVEGVSSGCDGCLHVRWFVGGLVCVVDEHEVVCDGIAQHPNLSEPLVRLFGKCPLSDPGKVICRL